MGLSNFKVFQAKQYVKPRIKRLSSGEFEFNYQCGTGFEICDRYLAYILFMEASCGSIYLQGEYK